MSQPKPPSAIKTNSPIASKSVVKSGTSIKSKSKVQEHVRLVEKKEEKDNSEGEKLPFGQLFEHATSTDYSLLCLGSLGSILAGATWPLLNIFFSRVVDVFANFEFSYPFTVDNATQQENLKDHFLHDIYMHSAAITGVTAGSILGSYITLVAFGYFSLRLIRLWKRLYFQSLLSQEISWHDQQNSGEFASRITSDFKKLEGGVNQNLGIFLMNTLGFFFNVGTAFYNGWKLSLVTMSLMPVTAIINGVVGKFSAKWTKDGAKAASDASVASEEAISAVRTVYAFNGQEKEVQRYDKSLSVAMSFSVWQNFASSLTIASTWFSLYGSFSVGIYFAAQLILDREYTLADVLLVFWSLLSAGMNISLAAPYFESLQIALASGSVIYSIINRKSAINPLDSGGGKLKDDFKADIEFRNVTFYYPTRPDVRVLNGLNLRISSGEIVALVGPSGCGKSTCLQLIQRFYDPAAGSIMLSGQDIRELNVGWLRSRMGIVGQEPILFDNTIEENIRLGVEMKLMDKVTLDDIKRVATEANAAEFIERLPNKYKTNVGERGAQLSGGQKQRISIARSLLGKPKILLLDEATSALDMRSETIVQAALDRAVKGRTTVIVAHRLSTIRNAHRIVYLDKGQVLEQGSHEELMAKKGAYYNLVAGQQVNTESKTKVAAVKAPIAAPAVKTISDKKSPSLGRRKSYIEMQKAKDESERLLRETPFPWCRLLGMLWEDKCCFIWGVFGAFVFGALTPAYAVVFGRFVDALVTRQARQKTLDEVKICAIYYALIAIGAFVTTSAQISLFGYIGEHLTYRMRMAAYRALMSKSIAYFDRDENSSGTLCSRLADDASNIQEATGARISMFFQAISSLLIALAISFYYNWQMALVCLGLIPFIIISAVYSGGLQMKQAGQDSNAAAMASKLAIEVLNNIRTVVSLHKERYFLNKFLVDLVANFRQIVRDVYLKSGIIAISMGIPFFVFLIALLFGSHLVSKRLITTGDFFTIVQAMLFGSLVIGQAAVMSSSMAVAKLATLKIFMLVDDKSDKDMPEELTTISTPANKRCRGELTFSQTEFYYPNRPEIRILSGLSFSAKVGETVALVGESGCGKSTCIQLIEQFYQPTGGQVQLDGKSLRDYPVRWTRAQMALVQQEPILFSYSIRENIAYGDLSRDVPDADIIMAAKLANIHDFIQQLPEGYGTPVGSKGVVSLSGGQKQRIAIARALVRNPQVVLLDEATSALDNESEKLVQQALDKAAKNRTCIVIAHKLKTIVGANKIVVLARGGIKVEEGTHQELIDRQGAYWKLYQSAMTNLAQH